jgi:psiF repeat
MKTLSISLGVALTVIALAFTSSISAQESKPKTAQQQKFADCAHQSKGMKGDEHKKFMSDCLGGKTDAMNTDAADGTAKKGTMEHKSSAQDDKKKACSSEAKSKKLTGDARKAFMSECLKGNK